MSSKSSQWSSTAQRTRMPSAVASEVIKVTRQDVRRRSDSGDTCNNSRRRHGHGIGARDAGQHDGMRMEGPMEHGRMT